MYVKGNSKEHVLYTNIFSFFLIYEFLQKKIDPLVYLRCPVPMMKYSLYEVDQILSQKLNINVLNSMQYAYLCPPL